MCAFVRVLGPVSMLVGILLPVHYRPRTFLYTVKDIRTHAYTYVSLRVNRN